MIVITAEHIHMYVYCVKLSNKQRKPTYQQTKKVENKQNAKNYVWLTRQKVYTGEKIIVPILFKEVSTRKSQDPTL